MIPHRPVLLQPVLAALDPVEGETILDATINRAGHSLPIAERLGSTGHLIGLDADGVALAAAEANLRSVNCRQTFINGNFRRLAHLLEERGVTRLDGALFDLGLSSEELADPVRGFSFQTDGPLRMTFSGLADTTFTAEEIVNSWEEENLAQIFVAYGEEPFAKRIAKAIVTARKLGPLKTTGELVAVIGEAVPTWYRRRRLHYATRTFQALRMTVNDEVNALRDGLAGAWSLLTPSARLVVISFHGLEARIIKDFFRQEARALHGHLLTKHAIKPERAQVLENSRARSAELRILEKIL